MDYVEGGGGGGGGFCYLFGSYFLALEAQTRAPKARASMGCLGHAPSPKEILQI